MPVPENSLTGLTMTSVFSHYLCSFALKVRHHPDGWAVRLLCYNTHISLKIPFNMQY